MPHLPFRLCNILLDPDINYDYVCQLQPTPTMSTILIWLTEKTLLFMIWVFGNVMEPGKLSFLLLSQLVVLVTSLDSTSCIIHGIFMVQVKMFAGLLCPLKVLIY